MNHPFYLLERITLASQTQNESQTNIEIRCFAMCDIVKTLQGLGMLNVSVVLWVQGSVISRVRWFR